MKGKGPGQKGTFGRAGLPVAASYLYPVRRWRLLAAAGAVAVGVVVLAVFAESLGRRELMSNGPLSASHATFEASCDSCHARGAGVSDERCAACHERFGDGLGVYSLAAHNLYGTRDLERLDSDHRTPRCRACHGEHYGRDAAITRVPDERCAGCHPFGSFVRGHPEFDAVAGDQPGSDSLSFPHIHHVRELLRSGGVRQLEEACLRCHQPQPDGRSFEPIRFDAHCAGCHLPPATATARLPIAGGPGRPGVVPVEQIRRAGRLGTGWALALGGEAFRRLPPDRLVKQPVTHADPWVLDNLRRLQAALDGGDGLGGLLRTTAGPAGGEPDGADAVWREAVATLKAWADELAARPQPELQADLGRVRRALAELEDRLADPRTPLDLAAFAAGGRPASGVAARDIEEVARGLAEPCLRCHRLVGATFERPPSGQDVLRRAEFDHRAHVLQAGCLDCHHRIPFDEWLDSSDAVPAELDRAAIQNLPGVAICRDCHGAAGAPAGCVTCHLFHPDKERHGRLLVAAAD